MKKKYLPLSELVFFCDFFLKDILEIFLDFFFLLMKKFFPKKYSPIKIATKKFPIIFFREFCLENIFFISFYHGTSSNEQKYQERKLGK